VPATTPVIVPAPVPAPQQQAQLPQFPVAPTSNPQSFSLYGASIPAGGVEQNDRQEALLIDL
jgi:growth factor-regulated tyrosine kinase substrate